MPFKEKNPPVFSITRMVREDYRHMFSQKTTPMHVATVVHTLGHNFTFSHREDDETGAWYADALILPSGMPSFVHGNGDRIVAKHRATLEVEAMLEERMENGPISI